MECAEHSFTSVFFTGLSLYSKFLLSPTYFILLQGASYIFEFENYSDLQVCKEFVGKSCVSSFFDRLKVSAVDDNCQLFGFQNSFCFVLDKISLF